MKIIVIGCTHAGTAAIVNMATLYPDAEITAYERNDNISFLSCGIALYVGGVVKDPQGLFYSSPEKLKDLGVTMLIKHNVKSVDTIAKTLLVENLETGEVFSDSYDKLVVTTGSWPIVPNLEGGELENIMLCKNWNHSNAIIEHAKAAKRIAVVGAGYIGVELVEAFAENGKQVTLIDTADRILSKYLDSEITDVVEKDLSARGITLGLGQTVVKFAGDEHGVSKVITTKGEYAVDLVVLCIGFRPQTDLFKGQLEMLGNGAIIVDEYMRTSAADVYAAGDSCAVLYNPTGKPAYIPLATSAVRMGTLVAKNLMGPRVRYVGTQGTSGIKIYEQNIASTGLTVQAAEDAELKVKAVTIVDNYRPEFMPTVELVTLKVVYEEESGKILGAQLMSKAELTQSINTISVCIQAGMTMEELGFTDFFFQPHFNKPWNFLNSAGLEAVR
ncbi:MAG: FAD-dependent oxidoreductase [Gorillibacterium sp.]|nr:FAD-dependent oxidoreductase [Gorillibacterium sp.]